MNNLCRRVLESPSDKSDKIIRVSRLILKYVPLLAIALVAGVYAAKL
jgi:hypothetical protein